MSNKQSGNSGELKPCPMPGCRSTEIIWDPAVVVRCRTCQFEIRGYMAKAEWQSLPRQSDTVREVVREMEDWAVKYWGADRFNHTPFVGWISRLSTAVEPEQERVLSEVWIYVDHQIGFGLSGYHATAPSESLRPPGKWDKLIKLKVHGTPTGDGETVETVRIGGMLDSLFVPSGDTLLDRMEWLWSEHHRVVAALLEWENQGKAECESCEKPEQWEELHGALEECHDALDVANARIEELEADFASESAWAKEYFLEWENAQAALSAHQCANVREIEARESAQAEVAEYKKGADFLRCRIGALKCDLDEAVAFRKLRERELGNRIAELEMESDQRIGDLLIDGPWSVEAQVITLRAQIEQMKESMRGIQATIPSTHRWCLNELAHWIGDEDE